MEPRWNSTLGKASRLGNKYTQKHRASPVSVGRNGTCEPMDPAAVRLSCDRIRQKVKKTAQKQPSVKTPVGSKMSKWSRFPCVLLLPDR